MRPLTPRPDRGRTSVLGGVASFLRLPLRRRLVLVLAFAAGFRLSTILLRPTAATTTTSAALVEALPAPALAGAPSVEEAAAAVAAAASAGCADLAVGCAGWAATGECASNAGFMHTSCAASCGTCAPPAGPAPPPDDPLGPGWVGDVVALNTSLGAIRVALRPDLAPRTVEYVLALARATAAAAAGAPGGCAACRFYRSEALPKPGAVDNFGGPGPPYALVQGSLSSPLFKEVAKEGAPLVDRGDACLIGSGPDFFLAVGPHHEWGNGHTVWGRVRDAASLAVVDAIAAQPVKEEVWGQTHVTTLLTPLPFTLALLPRA